MEKEPRRFSVEMNESQWAAVLLAATGGVLHGFLPPEYLVDVAEFSEMVNGAMGNPSSPEYGEIRDRLRQRFPKSGAPA